MRIPNSRLQMVALLTFLITLGLSMVAGPCYPDDYDVPKTPYNPPYVTNVPPPTIPPTKRPADDTPTPEPTQNLPEASKDSESADEPESVVPLKPPIEDPSDTSNAPHKVNPPETAVPTGTPTDTETVAPIADLTPRDSRQMLSFEPLALGASDFEFDTPTVEEVLEHGLFESAGSPVHIAVRAIPETGSVRCEWQSIARTLEQREKLLRFPPR